MIMDISILRRTYGLGFVEDVKQWKNKDTKYHKGHFI